MTTYIGNHTNEHDRSPNPRDLSVGPRARRALSLIAPLGPLAMAGWALALPYPINSPKAEWIPALADDMARTQLAMWMFLLFALTGGVGAIVVGLVARAGSPRLGTVGMVLAFVGFSTVSFLGVGYDGAAVATVNAGYDVATAEAVLSELDELQAPTIGAMLFIPLMAIGVILLGIALWRGRTTPRWSAALMVAAFPVIVAGGAAANAGLAAGWLLLAVAFGVASCRFADGEQTGTEAGQ